MQATKSRHFTAPPQKQRKPSNAQQTPSERTLRLISWKKTYRPIFAVSTFHFACLDEESVRGFERDVLSLGSVRICVYMHALIGISTLKPSFPST
jgi:hypothetical protein